MPRGRQASDDRSGHGDRGPRPVKLCAACGRPFQWRRKWARCWDAVRYCSDRCRAAGRRG